MIRPEFGALALALLLTLHASPSRAASELETIESALDAERRNELTHEAAAGEIDHELIALKRRLVAAAARSQEHEEKLSLIEARLREMTRREAELSAALDRRKASQTAALGALMRLGRQPPQALIATPAAIDETIRTSLLLETTASLLGREARRLGAALDDLTVLHRRIASRRMELDEAAAGLARERERLAALHASAAARRRDAGEQQTLAARRVALLAAEADSLRELSTAVLALREETSAPDRLGQPFAAARGSLPMPARGRLIGLFGDGDGGLLNKGITIETRDDAQVITPYDGEVVYAGLFRGYGRLLIIDHGEGYHTLLAGLSRIDSVQGQWLLAGEPVGVMGHGLTIYKTLYVELRYDGVAINPLPWMAANDEKADG